MLASHREGVEIHGIAFAVFAFAHGCCFMALPEVDDATFARMQTLVRQESPTEMVGMAEASCRGPLSKPLFLVSHAG